MNVKLLLHLEGLALFAGSLYFLFGVYSVSWWILPIVLLGPDLSMVGYFVNKRVGAGLYNAAHTLVTGIAVFMIGYVMNSDATIIAGIILVGHIGMDRMFGYGLKYEEGFKITHLGRV